MPIIGLALVPTLLDWPVLLLPVHIVLLELLIDPACSIVFEAEPESTDIMTRPPRALTASPFNARNLGFAVLQGSGMAAILLLGNWIFVALGFNESERRVAVFAGLVLGLLLLILSNRDLSRSAIMGFAAPNPWIKRMFAAVTLLLVAIIAIPFLRSIMGFAPMATAQLAASLALVVGLGVWLESLRRAAAGLLVKQVNAAAWTHKRESR